MLAGKTAIGIIGFAPLPYLYQKTPECSVLQSGDEWHPNNSPPLMGGDKGLPARASQWQAGIKGEEVVLASFRCPAAWRGVLHMPCTAEKAAGRFTAFMAMTVGLPDYEWGRDYG